MNKDLHDIDDLFRSELDAYEETPSAGVKERIEAALDKKNAESYRRKFIGWKRIALLLLLILAGFALYESGILKTSSGRSDKRTADRQTNYSTVEKHKGADQKNTNNTITDNTNNDSLGSYNRETIKNKGNNTNKEVSGDNNVPTLPNQKEITVPVAAKTNENGLNKRLSGNKITEQKSNRKQSNSLIESEKKEIHGIQSNPEENSDSFLKIGYPSLNGKNNSLQSPEISISQMIAGLTKSTKQLQAINDSLLKNKAKNTIEKKAKFFKPFWMITAFASYERAGYRLDSDLPINITNIKHSEVHEPSFSLGILATRQLKKHWGLQTGLIYSLTDIGISPQKLYALQNTGGDISFKYITSSGYAYIKPGLGAPPAIGDSLITTEGKHRLKVLSVPLIVKYSVGKNKLTLTPGAGLEANFLTSAKVETEVESPSNPEIIFINKLDGAKTIYLSVVADAELRYKLNNKLSVSLRPAIRIATTPITENNVVETFPHSVGIGVGLTWKF